MLSSSGYPGVLGEAKAFSGCLQDAAQIAPDELDSAKIVQQDSPCAGRPAWGAQRFSESTGALFRLAGEVQGDPNTGCGHRPDSIGLGQEAAPGSCACWRPQGRTAPVGNPAGFSARPTQPSRPDRLRTPEIARSAGGRLAGRSPAPPRGQRAASPGNPGRSTTGGVCATTSAGSRCSQRSSRRHCPAAIMIIAMSDQHLHRGLRIPGSQGVLDGLVQQAVLGAPDARSQAHAGDFVRRQLFRVTDSEAGSGTGDGSETTGLGRPT